MEKSLQLLLPSSLSSTMYIPTSCHIFVIETTDNFPMPHIQSYVYPGEDHE